VKRKKLIVYTAIASGFAFGTVANAGISLTRHNLSTSGSWNYTTVGGKYTVGGTGGVDNGNNDNNDEICVFCHTPHGANAEPIGPLWNREFNNKLGAYTLYDSWTIDGNKPSNVGNTRIAGSMLCLSCHDGTQAIDTLINAPTWGSATGGSGGNGYKGGTASDQGWAWTESKWMSSGVVGGELAYIGTDLTNDHPVMIQYGGGGLTSSGGSLSDPDFFMPSTTVRASTTYWYFDTDSSGGMSGHDVKMYTYANGGSGLLQPYVECYTCHDPHDAMHRPFLRISNSDSSLCLTCHNK